MMMMMIKDSRN